MELFAKMTLCPSLSSFRFSPDANLDLGILNPIDEELSVRNVHLDHDDDMGGDDFNDDGNVVNADGQEDFFGDMNRQEDFNDYGGGGDEDHHDGEDDGELGQGQIEPFRPGGNGGGERDLVMSMAGNGEQMFDYFDSALMKNWAGPEHWKMRRIAVKKGISTLSLCSLPINIY
jgi:condensin complex subunit 2